MRVGHNPHKNKQQEDSEYIHQVIIPVYIPNEEEYFKDSFRIFQLCLDSLFATTHDKTFISIVNNGSTSKVLTYLDELLNAQKIHEVIQTTNVGKLNAILKGLVGNNIELVTISDADVLFCPNWQKETTKIFNRIPKAGVVGLVPQFKMYESNCGNIIFDNFFSNKLKFIPVKNPSALIRFYESIGWDYNYNKDYLAYSLGYQMDDLTVYVGSGHFVATYKRDVFDKITSYIGYKMGGTSEAYLDKAPLKKGYWRLTTYDNYAYHMGNVYEDWMQIESSNQNESEKLYADFNKNTDVDFFSYFIKNRFLVKLISSNLLMKGFLKFKKLPNAMIEKY
nr:glycosyltransferase family 2 protein [uncultured Flavobacterium sp.]